MVVQLPSQLDKVGMYSLIRQTITTDFQPSGNEIIYDFSTLSFIEPVGVTVLSNLTEWLSKRNVSVKYRFPRDPAQNSAIMFLDDSQFFKRYNGKTIKQLAFVRNTTIPLEPVSYKESYQWLERTAHWLSRALGVTPASLADIKVCIQEIFNNINDHSQEHIGCVFAQHFPNIREVKIAISDFGVGIPYNIRQIRPSLTDAQAIKLASEQGFSTKSTPRNRGAGLDTLIHNVVSNLQGDVYIHSNHGILNCTYGNEVGVSIRPVDNSGFYPGTLIEIVFKTDAIENIMDSEERFEWG